MGARRARLLVIAAIFNCGVGLPLLLTPELIYTILALDPLSQVPLFERITGLLVTAFGMGYWLASANTLRYRDWLLIGALVKVGGFTILSIVALQYPDLWPLFLLGIADLLFAITFFWQLRKDARADSIFFS